MKKSVEEFIYPNELLREKIPFLLDYYGEDYGEEYTSIMKNRIDNTLYLFDSNPIEMMDFVVRNGDKIDDSILLKRIECEYKNYKRIYSLVHSRLMKKYYSLLATYYSLSGFSMKEELLSLDMESYSYYSISKSRMSEEEKNKLRERQEKYRDNCSRVGVKPITNPAFVQILIDEKMRMKEKEFLILLKTTKWGKRIIRTFKKYCPTISISEISKVMRDDSVALTSYLLDKNGRAESWILYFPIVHSIYLQSLDLIFFHENRHVVESSLLSSGLNSHYGGTYRLINEIRTEKNAIIDSSKLPNDFLWSSDDIIDSKRNSYQELFPYVASFFEDYRDELNRFAVTGDIASFEEKFGKEELKELEMFLGDIYSLIKDSNLSYKSLEKKEEGAQLVKKISYR